MLDDLAPYGKVWAANICTRYAFDDEGDSEVATFACIQLIHMGALVPSVHSPNTYTHCLCPYIVILH